MKRKVSKKVRQPKADYLFPRHFEAAEGDVATIDEAIAHLEEAKSSFVRKTPRRKR